MLNSFFSANKDDPKSDPSYVFSKRHGGRIEPLHKNVRPESTPIQKVTKSQKPAEPVAVVGFTEAANHPKKSTGKLDVFSNPAVTLIRSKLDSLYASEPDVQQEIKEIAQMPPSRSKHQQFMYDLSTSGKSLAEIQTAWHNYYVGLPDAEKHEVWQEFYEANSRQQSAYSRFVAQQETLTTAQPPETTTRAQKKSKATRTAPQKSLPVLPHSDRRSPRLIKKQLLDRMSAETQEKAKRHLKSLFFGLSTGFVVLVIFLFGFFNEVIIAPFIQPSRKAAATPIILSAGGVAPSSQNEVIIPKISVEIPLDFSVSTTDEHAIDAALENGVVHYPTTVRPGQQGNTAFFGHSSNNIFNKGKYKFAFVLLHNLVPGDIFYITYNGTVYGYKVYDKKIVEPTDVWVLGNVAGKAATATLITCDPPGTSLRRLVVWAEQVSPDPGSNTAASAAPPSSSAPATQLPSNSPTLWGRFVHWLTSS